MATILKFRDGRRLKSKVARYLEDPSLIADEGDHAITVLARAFKWASMEDRKRMFLVLSTLAQDELCWILVRLLEDNEADEELKDQVAIYLSVIGAFVSNPQLLNKKLNNIIENTDDKDTRIRAIVALGWEENTLSIPILAELLHDPDSEIQEAAVTAMCNLEDSRLFGILTDRMKNAPFAQKKAILYNLWRFKGKEEEALKIYMEEVDRGDNALKVDILSILMKMGDSIECEGVLRAHLNDPDPEVRLLSAKALLEMEKLTQEDVESLMDDPSMKIKRFAIRAVQKIDGR